MLKIGYRNPNGIRHPRRLFAPASEAFIATLPMRPRYMELPQSRPGTKRPRAVRTRQKGAAPC